MNVQGTPVLGTITFSSNTTTTFQLTFSGIAGGNYTPAAPNKVYIVGVVASTNDSASNSVVIDDGAGGQVLSSGFCSTTAQFTPTFAPGVVRSRPGQALRATLAGQTATKSTVVTVYGYLSQS